MLTLEGICHHYEPGPPVLDMVDLHLDPGELVGLVGPSGSGKSTLLAIAGLVTRPVSGIVRHGDAVVDVTSAPRILGHGVAWLFQDNNVFGARSARENVALGLRASGMPWSDALLAANDALVRVGLRGRETELVTKLSGGEAQRVGVARVLAQQPTLLLCDEPTAQLDRANSVRVFEALGEMRHTSTTALIATHDLQVAAIADRVIELDGGTIKAWRP